MKLHDLAPSPGAHTPRTRVGRGIAAGKGKTAGRGTKGQKARAGGSVPAWFEGGQTPLHQRIPKLRGFRNRGRVVYETVNVGRIAAAAAAGRLPSGDLPGSKKAAKPAPVTANAELLRVAGLVRHLDRPLKILGGGEVDRPLAVIADAFTASAIAKIEAAGGTATRLEVPAPAPTAARRGPGGRTKTAPDTPASEVPPGSAETEALEAEAEPTDPVVEASVAADDETGDTAEDGGPDPEAAR
jgi:large subunit ribosomal protein L15